MTEKKIFSGRPISPCVLALGTFDGVHAGHRLLIENTLRLAASLGMSAGVFFFEIPPAAYFSADFPGMITDKNSRFELFGELGLDFAVAADFPGFRNITSADFIGKVLKTDFGCMGAVCGFNYTFGSGASGGPEDLKNAFGDNFICVGPFMKDGKIVSSSRIREMIAAGDTEGAAAAGTEYSVCAEVIGGRREGRTLGFPTINQRLPENIVMPKKGVYVSRVGLPDGRVFPGVTDIGNAPTLTDARETVLETHICGFQGDLYGKNVKITLCTRIRDEKKFSSVDELVSRIRSDKEFAERYFSSDVRTP